MFILFAELLVSAVAWIFGSSFDSYLIANLFKTTPKKNRQRANRTADYRDAGLKQIAKRDSATISLFKVCIRDKKSSMILKQGQESISREIDILRFIRRQKMYEVALKSLFTRVELFFMKN